MLPFNARIGMLHELPLEAQDRLHKYVQEIRITGLVTALPPTINGCRYVIVRSLICDDGVVDDVVDELVAINELQQQSRRKSTPSGQKVHAALYTDGIIFSFPYYSAPSFPRTVIMVYFVPLTATELLMLEDPNAIP